MTNLAWSMPGGTEWIVILVVALIVFGRRLPEVARSAGRSIIEFKKGMRDTQDEIDHSSKKSLPPREIPAEDGESKSP